jgi:hypothetical protein
MAEETRKGEAMSEPTFWSCDDDVEELVHTEMEEAIECHLDNLWPLSHEFGYGNDAERIEAFLKALPLSLTVYGFTRAVVPSNAREVDPDSIIERIMEDLEDSEFGGGDSEWEERTTPEGVAAILAAATALSAAVIANYVPWSCERTLKVEIDPIAWIKANNPEWLVATKTGVK